MSQSPAPPAVPPIELRRMANAIRFLAMDAVEAARSGHPGMPMGMADAATVLVTRFLKFDAAAPGWPDRDRLVLSAGHGSMLLYALLHLTGHADMTMDELRRFRQFGSRTAGHPEYGHASGIETTTGPLGQGFANAVGMALAESRLAARFGPDLVDHDTYVIVGDGCLMEGISHEAASLAGHLRLGRLITLFDDNHISIDGPTELAVSDDVPMRFESYGWHVIRDVDGHDPEAVAAAIAAARAERERPSFVALRTTIGFGAPSKAGTAATHGAPLGADEIAGARARLGWPHAPFEVPEDIAAAWRDAGSRGATGRAAWQERLAGSADRATFESLAAGTLPDGWAEAMSALKRSLSAERPKIATRVASQRALETLSAAVPQLLGGSADLSGSNNTKVGGQAPFTAADRSGSYLHYGVREHAMVAAMNGIALHGGAIPYGGTFLVFTDYCRPSIRLAALMGLRVILVMTHDSIGLGEDGPTHQPVEHLASLRAMPNLMVLRPADAVETAECWALALERQTGPTLLALTRQGVATVRTTHTDENLSARGAYLLSAPDGDRAVTLIATGSEVGLALAARDRLAEDGVAAAVVTMPCVERFIEQDAPYRASVLGPDGGPRVAVEAASGFGWDRLLGPGDRFVGMTGFGASAPAEALYAHFGITADAIASAARSAIAARDAR